MENLRREPIESIIEIDCYCGSFTHREKIDENEKFKLMKTATTPMRINAHIGNVCKIDNGFCNVDVSVDKKLIKIKNVRILDKDLKVFQRVILSEHVNVDGQIEWIATRRPLQTGDLNFLVMCKTKNNKIISKKRIDVVTGEIKSEMQDD